MLSGDHLGAGADHHLREHAVHGVGVTGLADADDPPLLNTNIRLDHTQYWIHHYHIGDYKV